MPSKKSSPPLPPLFHPLENTRANTLLNELFLRESFNFIRWKNSTSPRGFFRCSPLPPLPLFLKVPLTWLGKPRWGKIFPFNGHSFKLRRPTVEKSDQRFSSSARSTLSANVQASLMFSHGIIFLFLFPSLFIFLSHSVCLFVCLPPPPLYPYPDFLATGPDLDLRTCHEQKARIALWFPWISNECQRSAIFFSFRQAKFHRWTITRLLLLETSLLESVVFHAWFYNQLAFVLGFRYFAIGSTRGNGFAKRV